MPHHVTPVSAQGFGALFGWQCNAWNIRVFPENNDASSPMFWNSIEGMDSIRQLTKRHRRFLKIFVQDVLSSEWNE
jgi:hypothetical protein